ncbi:MULTISPECIES: LL-diaminopimelate aminotransferase [Methanocorpusculum]|jgi:LL-diaminopimelate aminotransferase|uniref:Aminotransferase n=1 Tax=Methanocorpusculum parvum TaxID=2193 RepID=A0AAX0Q7M0_9EURY|nr:MULTISPECIES: LL-diaminopimelate aminotransferase [Methanocorpusculum]MDD2248948.1 LL-diaminopimelate aminotransferase [Methanocorpusculum sp.]MDD2803419.1 LL-diaminopimelate aminotransferase [Methanocorpusculum sp.]MDD3047315.1 LL-diaminopimelate aminotransferase [Methanocorpusculum sp.]MDD3912504.1 LL-diaminopimelate aminotransferase [Methanocorpusculum sp.]MDD4423769.1 LL-diaminopimelate aminotransferase [Methanocorpusculum parvum]
MYAKRLDNLPPYLFAQIDALKAQKRAEGIDLIDLGVGDPDLPTPKHIVDALCEAARDPSTHHYPDYLGMLAYRQAVASWYDQRFGVKLDPKKEVLALIGSKEGIAHIPEAFVNPGDYVLVSDPGYPVYKTSTLFAEGKSHPMPLLEENGFLPDYAAIPKDVLKNAKLMFIGYPNNPTGAAASIDFFEETVEFAKDNDIIVVHDNAYSEISFDGYKSPSFLQAKGAMDVGLETHSLSKTYNMTGWRIGMCVGNAGLIEAFGRVKTNIDSGVFDAVQRAAITALTGPQDCVAQACAVYQERRDALVTGLRSLGFDVTSPKASFYVWMKVPDSVEFVAKMINEAGIVITPGTGFGASGAGYVRFAMTRPVDRINEAVRRMKECGIRG